MYGYGRRGAPNEPNDPKYVSGNEYSVMADTNSALPKGMRRTYGNKDWDRKTMQRTYDDPESGRATHEQRQDIARNLERAQAELRAEQHHTPPPYQDGASAAAPVATGASASGPSVFDHTYAQAPVSTAGTGGYNYRVKSRRVTGQELHPTSDYDVVTDATVSALNASGAGGYAVTNMGHRVWSNQTVITGEIKIRDVISQIKGQTGVAPSALLYSFPLFTPELAPRLCDVMDLPEPTDTSKHSHAKFREATGDTQQFFYGVEERGVSRSGLYEKLCPMGGERIPVDKIAMHGATIDTVSTNFPIPLGVRVTGARNTTTTAAGKCVVVVAPQGPLTEVPVTLDIEKHGTSDLDYGSFSTMDAARERRTIQAQPRAGFSDKFGLTPNTEAYARVLAERAGGEEKLQAHGIFLGSGEAYATSSGADYLIASLMEAQSSMRVMPTNELQISVFPICRGGWPEAIKKLTNRCLGHDVAPEELVYDFYCTLSDMDLTFNTIGYHVGEMLEQPMKLSIKSDSGAGAVAPVSTGAKGAGKKM